MTNRRRTTCHAVRRADAAANGTAIPCTDVDVHTDRRRVNYRIGQGVRSRLRRCAPPVNVAIMTEERFTENRTRRDESKIESSVYARDVDNKKKKKLT